MSVILGINTYHAGSSAAIIVDGVPMAALAEERLNRIKYYAGFPKLAIARCLEITGLTFSDIDVVAVGRDASANRHKKLQYVVRHPTRLLNAARILMHSRAFKDIRGLIASECEVDVARLRFKTCHVEHHLAHIASAYFASAWEHSAGITIDGSGDFVSCLLTECVGNNIRPLKKIFVPHSLGTYYTAGCQFIGYGQYGDEGKVMGLAPFGEDAYHDLFQRMLKLTAGGIELDGKYFMTSGADGAFETNEMGEMIVHRHYSDLFITALGPPREGAAPITKRDRDVAHSLQKGFERGYLHLLKSLHQLVPVAKVALAGGCALNSVANGRLLRETPFRETCIQPAAGDDGLVLGAALYVSNVTLKEGRRWVMKDAYLGDEYSDEMCKAELDRHKISWQRLSRPELIEQTAEEIKNGSVVGWFQGRMEWGPRALGNRSILAHPGLPAMKDVLNARIKQRESFRPFAPSVLLERQAELFEQDHPSPFMLHVYKIRPAWHDRLSAVRHVDNTGRLQTVARAENPLYYDLIAKFETKTGIPAILNTSFNENEPIVRQPAEAIACFLRTRMDVLVIGSFICRKASQV